MENSSMNNFDDEHILARYWLVLLRRWWVVAIVFVAILAGGVVYANTRPPLPFPHATAIEIGRFADGPPLEAMNLVTAKMKDAYIPLVLNGHGIKYGYDQTRYSIAVETPEEGSNTLILNSYGSESSTPTLLYLQQKVVDLLVQDHLRRTALVKNDLTTQESKAQTALEDLKTQERLLPRKQKSIEDTAQLLKRQIDELQQFINAAQQDRTSALASATAKGTIDQPLTTTLFLIDTTIADSREKLRGLQERYLIALQNDRVNFEKEEIENKRQQKEQEQLIKDIEFRISNLQETKVIFPPSRLLRKSPQGPAQTVGLFGAVGLFFGIFAAGFVEFASNARTYGRTVGRS